MVELGEMLLDTMTPSKESNFSESRLNCSNKEETLWIKEYLPVFSFSLFISSWLRDFDPNMNAVGRIRFEYI